MESTWKEKSLEDLADKLVLARGSDASRDGSSFRESRGRAVFLVGAGCSASAGIPLGADVARQCARDLANTYATHDRSPGAAPLDFSDADKALRWLIENRRVQDRRGSDGKPDWGAYYSDFFDNHLTSVNRQREFFDEVIRKAADKMNWAHICLGELIARRYVHTVLTTNFDQLVLQGVIRTGQLPVIADGIEALNRVTAEPRRPQIVHLHGSMHTYNPRNTQKAIMDTRQDPTLRSMLYTILHRCDLLVVVGYAGGEEGVMELLREAARQLPPLVVFWVLRDQSSALSVGAEELMNIGDNKFVVRCPDADTLFQGLMSRLKIGEPTWMKDPIASLQDQVAKLSIPKDPELRKAVARFQARVQHIDTSGRREDTATEEMEALRLAGRYEEVLAKLVDLGTLDAELLSIRAATNLDLVQESRNDQGRMTDRDQDRLKIAIKDFSQLASQSAGAERLEFHRQLFGALMMSYDEYERKDDLSTIIEAVEKVPELYDGVPDKDAIGVRLLVAQAYQQRGAPARDETDMTVADLEKAEAEYRKVKSATDGLRDLKWTESTEGLATTLQALGEKQSMTDDAALKEAAVKRLEEAVFHHQDILVCNVGARSVSQAGRLHNLGVTILSLAMMDPKTLHSLRNAQKHLQDAIDIYLSQDEDLSDKVKETEMVLNDVKVLLRT